MYLVRSLRCYLLHLKLLFLQSTIFKKSIRDSKCLSYLARQPAVLYKDNDRATEKSHAKGVADKSNSKNAAYLYHLLH